MDDVAYGANFWNAVDDAMPAINPVKPESNSDNSTHDIYSIGNIETTLENLQRNRFESQERY